MPGEVFPKVKHVYASDPHFKLLKAVINSWFVCERQKQVVQYTPNFKVGEKIK